MDSTTSDRILQHFAARLDDESFARMFSPDGLAPTCDWQCEDDWIVSYTTKRIRHGRLDGLFAVMYYEPQGDRWERVKLDRCDTRKEAKQRALTFFYAHSPKRAAKHGWNGSGYDNA